MWTHLALVMLLGAPAPAAASSPAAATAAAAAPRYAASLAAAQEEARKSGKPILVKFYTSWCGWCRKMDRETFRDPRVIARSEKDLVFVALNGEDGDVGSKLAAKLRVSSYPAIAILEADGRELGKLAGYRPAERFVADLDRVLAKRSDFARLLDAEKATPKDPQVLWDLALVLEREGRADEAARRYQAILALRDERAARFRDVSLWNLAEIARRGENRNGALESYQRLLNEFPESRHAEEAQFQIARMHHLMGNIDDAIAGYEALLKRHPESRYANGVKLQLQALRQNYGRD